MDWLDVIPYFESEDFKDVTRYLAIARDAGFNVLPAKKDIFKAFELTPFEDVRVVVLGQDPYPNKEHAMGLAFSVPPEVHPLPKSLINIFKELKVDTGIVRTSGDLTGWAEQGVLLLNSHLTVLEGDRGSHATMGWTTLTNQAIRALNTHRNNVVFILWGQHAAPKINLIDDARHMTIVSAHPSPLSAYKGFFGSKPFSRTNDYLVAHEKEPIRW